MKRIIAWKLHRGAAGFLFATMLSQAVAAQSTLSGRVRNSSNEPVAAASISLLRAEDSSLLRGMVTDKEGAFVFRPVAAGRYLIEASYTGSQAVYTGPLALNGTETRKLSDIILTPSTKSLAQVTVVTRKPLFEQKVDRLVVNVASSVTSAGNTALEVLERSPGIVVDRQNKTISMNGKSGVVVMINGKISRMPIDAVVQLLNGMPSGNIEKIELINTPPANFDAQGNAGYINIVLKENNNYGTNGSFTVSAGRSSGSIAEASANINHREGAVNLFADFSFARSVTKGEARTYSYISNAGHLNGTVTEGSGKDTTTSLNARAGADFQLSKKSVIGILLTGYRNLFRSSYDAFSHLLIDGQTDSLVRALNDNHDAWKHYGANINFQHDFREGEKLLINLDYLHYGNEAPQNYHSNYYDASQKLGREDIFRNVKTTPITFLVGAIDYSRNLGKKVSLETGVKATLSRFDNDLNFKRLQNGNWTIDPVYTSHYKLRESYPAAYVALSASLPKGVELKAGLRYEYTSTNLGNDQQKNVVDRQYGKLFPSVFFTKKFSEKTSLSLSYSRRLTRPSFNDLAPFVFYQNKSAIVMGNPALQAAFADNFQAGMTISRLFFSISYSNEQHAIAGFQAHTDSVLNRTTISAENLVVNKSLSLSVGLPIRVAAWWNMQVNVNANANRPTLLYQGKEVSINQVYAGLNSTQTFQLPKNFIVEATGYFSTGGSLGLQSSHPSGNLDIGARKKLKGRNGTLSLNGTNVLNTGFFTAYTNLPAQNINTGIKLYYSRPGVKLTYTRTFGKEKLKEKRERSTGAENENGRAH